MNGLMMDLPLSVSSILMHAERFHRDAQIVSRRPEGGIHRYTYVEAASRSRKLANALRRLGVNPGDCVGTLAWNTHRHYELYFAVSGSGAIVHTINPRLFPEQIAYIANHAQDQVLFFDITFLPIVEKLKAEFNSIRHFVLLSDRAHMPSSTLPLLCYEELLEAQTDAFEWPAVDENAAAALCYTSGTTGHPKGVLYSHRSTVVHAWATQPADALGISNASVVLPVVPMFHVNAWGTPYAATMAGAKLVLPGPGLDGPSLCELINGEKATVLLGVPTVWLGLLQYCEQTGSTIESVKSVVVGGSAAPLAMIRAFQEKHGIFLIHAWGMTELSPLGTVNSLGRHMIDLPLEQRYEAQTRQGRPVFGIQMKIIGADGKELPHDGKAFGRLMVKGPWVASSYYKHEDRSAWVDGWFDTGDVATIDATGNMGIVDRAKDVIKSGGEWISSIDVENAVMGHPAVAECAVVGIPHPKWDERPLLLVVRKPGQSVEKDEILSYLAGKVAKWWLPDQVLFVDELPHTPTGKLLKRQLRDDYHGLYAG